MLRAVHPVFATLLILSAVADAQPLHILEVHSRRTGVTDIEAMAASPDGEHLYVASDRHRSLSVFSLDPVTREPTFVEIYYDDAGGVNGLGGDTRLAVSPDGRHLYVTGESVASVFRRQEDGRLRPVRIYWGGSEGIPLLSGTWAIALSPDGFLVFILSQSGDLLSFRRDPASGELTYLQKLEEPYDLFFGAYVLAVSPDSRQLYMGSSAGVTSFAIAGTGALSVLGAASPGMAVHSIVPSPDGRHVYTSDLHSGEIGVFRKETSGALTFSGSVSSGGGRLAVSEDGAHIYGCFSGGIRAFRRDPRNGSLALAAMAVLDPSGINRLGCEAMAFSNGGVYADIPSSYPGLAAFRHNPGSGAFALHRTLEEGEGAEGRLPAARSVVVSPDGAYVYVASGYGNLWTYRRNPANGRLSLLDTYYEDSLASSALSPDGRHLYGLLLDGPIRLFQRDGRTGRLTPAPFTPPVIPGRCCDRLWFSPDGRTAYTLLGFRGESVGVLRRNPATGALAFVEETQGSVEAIGRDLAVSPDGRHVYLLVDNPAAVVTLQHDPASRRLVQTDVVQDIDSLSSCIHGLTVASSLVLSPDGRHLYASSSFTQTIHTFQRDAGTGRLAYLRCGERPAAWLAMSRDGEFLYGSDSMENAFNVYLRHPVSGRLLGLGSLALPTSWSISAPVVSPDGANVYVPLGDDGLAVLGRDGASPSPPCSPSYYVPSLCLREGRFAVSVFWRDFAGNAGAGNPVQLTPESGYFWFFDASNLELALKILDGRSENDHFWVFYASLSSVAYSVLVEDTESGKTRMYSNPAGQLASVGDTRAFQDTGTAAGPPLLFEPEHRAAEAGSGPCASTATVLCLQGGRFRAEIRWTDSSGQRHAGRAVSLTSASGYFWFFSETNVEILVKLLDGRPSNGHFWVFYGSLSNVEFELTVTDTVTGTAKVYRNPRGRMASRGDTRAFPSD